MDSGRELLRDRGHVVFTPTLAGMGERSHLGPRVGLGTHIEDVVAVLEFEDLYDVVLCGASYGGMAVYRRCGSRPRMIWAARLHRRVGACGRSIRHRRAARGIRHPSTSRGR